MSEIIKFNHEYEPAQKVRVGYIGCGDHSYRNVLPTFQYAPVELVACCDLDAKKAAAYARTFGAQESYTDHRKLLARPDVEAVFIVTNYDDRGHPRSTDLAVEALKAGKHVWMEKPPAAGVEGIRRMQQAAQASGKFVVVGFKKMFFSAIQKIKSLIGTPAFGKLTSIYIRYPQDLPVNIGDDRTMVGFLDHLVHPGSILQYLAGPVESIFYQREGTRGATATSIRFASGAVGVMHLASGDSGFSPLERLEVVGEGSNVVLENGIHLTWYRPGSRPAYGRAASFIVDDAAAPLHWTPEYSLGVLDNKAIFLLGYVGEVRYFCQCVKANTPPDHAHLADALEIMKLYEAFRQGEGKLIRV
jgi:predicted dehydrogenase